MQPGDDQLGGNEKQDNRGDAEEFLQIDPYAALDEHYAKQNGRGYAQQRADKIQQLACVERNRA